MQRREQIADAVAVRDGSPSKRTREEQKAVAQEVLDEFVSRRVKEDMPNIEKTRQAVDKIKADIEKATKGFKR